MAVPVSQVRKRRSMALCESESRLRSTCPGDHRTFPFPGAMGLVDTHLLRGRLPLAVAAQGGWFRSRGTEFS